MIAGEAGKTVIFNFDTKQWRNGKKCICIEKNWGFSLQYKNTFLAIGGEYKKQTDAGIHKYNPETESWEKAPFKLLRKARSLSVTFVTEEYLNCKAIKK